VIGYGLMDDPNVRFIDIHEDSRGVVVPLIAKRLELAKTIGCDAVVAELHDLLSYQANPGHGFENLQPSDYTSWSTALTERAHGLTLSMGLRSSTAMGIDGMARLFDWLLIERCGEFDDCDTSRSFIDLDRAVFAIEYDLDLDGNANEETLVCGKLAEVGIADGILKSAELSSGYYKRCMP
jgi:hypothetical protein